MQNSLRTDIFNVDGGSVSGYMTDDKAVNIFKGIPYAAPPIGNLRWKAPQPVVKWDGVRDCSTWASNAVQAKQEAFLMWSEEFIIDTSKGYSEDCLYLNIWSPNDNSQNHPVIVYVHGGNFISGGSSCEVYDGEQLARSGVIFVSINFRGGVLGLLACSALSNENENHLSGNYQLLDQIQALRWVKKNIHIFGGNPDNITLMGQSSGAAAVNTLAVSPLARGLFKRVIALSHSTFHLPTANVPTKTGNFFEQVNIYQDMQKCIEFGNEVTGSKTADELRAIPAQDLLAFTKQFFPYAIDNYVLDNNFHDGVIAGETNSYDYLTSYVANDYLLFWFIEAHSKEQFISGAQKFFGDMYGDFVKLYNPDDYPNSANIAQQDFLSAENYMFASARAKAGNNNTWLLRFERATPGPECDTWGAFHSSELAYLFRHYTPSRKDFWTDKDYSTGESFAGKIISFAASSNPGSDWERNKIYRLDAGIFEPYSDFTPEKLNFWSKYYHDSK